MSKDKAEEKAREYAIKKYGDELIFHEPYLETLGDFKAGYTQAVTDLSAENAQLREALRELVELTDKMENAKTDIEYNIASVARKDIITNAKGLIE